MKRTMKKMSPKGDETVREWDTEAVTPEQLKYITEEFTKLQKQGFFAADITPTEDGAKNTIIKDFDPQADILMLPRVMGG